MKTLKQQTINSLLGKPYKLPVRDEDGNVIWKKEYPEEFPLERREPKMEDATTVSIIKQIVTNIPREVQAGKDGFYSYNILNQLKEVDGKIELKDEEYAWLHRVIKGRLLPHTKEQKDAGIPPVTYGRWLFGMSDYTIQVQLTDIDTVPEEPKE